MQLKLSLTLTLLLVGATASNLVQAKNMNLFLAHNAPQDASVIADVRSRDTAGTITTITPVTLNLKALEKANKSFNLNIGPGQFFQIQQTGNGDTGGGYSYWHGVETSTTPSNSTTLNPNRVNFVISGQQVFGQIRMNGEVLEITTTQDGKHLLMGRDFSVIGTDDDTPVTLEVENLNVTEDMANSTILPTPLNQTIETHNDYRVMQLISQAAVNALGGTGPAVTRLNFFISQANEAYNLTGLPPKAISAGLFFSEGSSERSTAQSNVQGLVNLSDGFQDTSATIWRDDNTADLVALIVATPGDPFICGIVNAIGSTSSTQGFFVVKQSCTNYTWVHEVGHLFGARHDNDPTTSPFSFGHGIVQPSCNFRTIMAVSSNPEPRFGGFSDPGFTLGGCPFGSAGFEDNGRVHESRASTIAGFR